MLIMKHSTYMSTRKAKLSVNSLGTLFNKNAKNGKCKEICKLFREANGRKKIVMYSYCRWKILQRVSSSSGVSGLIRPLLGCRGLNNARSGRKEKISIISKRLQAGEWLALTLIVEPLTQQEPLMFYGTCCLSYSSRNQNDRKAPSVPFSTFWLTFNRLKLPKFKFFFVLIWNRTEVTYNFLDSCSID